MARHQRVAAGVIVAVALLASTSGCGGDGKKEPVDDTSSKASALSYDEATARAADYAQQTLSSVFPAGAALAELDGSNPVTTFCTDSSADPPPGTPVAMESDFKVTGADPTQVATYFSAFEKHWSDAGWDRRFGSVDEGALAMGSHEGFVVQIQYTGSNGLISLTVNTPCVAPKDPDNPLGERASG